MEKEFDIDAKRKDRDKKRKNKKLILIIAISVIIFGIIVSLFIVSATYNKIYKNISVCNIDIGNLSQKDAEALLNKEFELYTPVIQLNCNSHSNSLDFESIAQFDIEKTAENAFNLGKQNIFTKFWYYFFGKKNLPLEVIVNETELEAQLTDFQSSLPDPYMDTSYKIDDDILVVKAGTSGSAIDIETVSKEIVSLIKNGKDVVLDVTSSHKDFTGINVDDLYKKIFREPENAYYNEETSKIIPHIVGYSFDIQKATEIIGNAKNGEEFKIQLIVSYPDVTEDTLTGKMFADVLATYSTKYNPGEVNRTHNMYLASSKVNGTVLAPGEVFSYNNIVGERTVAKGYRNAKIFENGRVVDGLAGGICQVSTTIYNAALYSNLKIVERKNHSFPVAYAPMGQDATVVMGSIDFRFSNSTGSPIKIVSSVSGGLCTVSILGTEKNHYKVEIQNSILSSRPRAVEYENDPTLETGVEKVKQEGSDGYTVKTIRIVSKNGNVVKTESLPTSYYIPLVKIVLRNEGPAEEPENSDVTEPPTEIPPEEIIPPEIVPENPEEQPPQVILPTDPTLPAPVVPLDGPAPEADPNTGV
jgi:vancomycin resistance protein YoaR